MSTRDGVSSQVLITGASAGIGRELARVFAAAGHDLILVARRKTRLTALAQSLRKQHGIEVTVLPSDLGRPDAPQALFDDIAELGLVVDILVNNAGVLYGGAFRRMALDDLSGMVQLNIQVLTALCRLFVPGMVTRGGGRIMNLSSLGAFQPVPSLAVYAATKAYVLSFSEAMAQEVKAKGVSVTAVCPGFTDTAMLQGAQDGSASTMPSILVMTPEQVAEEAYKACMRGDVLKVPGLGNSLASAGVRLLPRWLVRNLSSFVVRAGR